MAIGIQVKKAPADHDLGASKFFGTPTVPLAWEGDFYEDEIFLCQINLADVAHLDKENRLPHTGYLYIFLHTDGGDYDLEADVRYFEGEPELAIDDFNLEVEGYERFNDAYLMEFCEVDDGEACTRLLGVPSDWNYEDKPQSFFCNSILWIAKWDFSITLTDFFISSLARTKTILKALPWWKNTVDQFRTI